MNGKEIEQQAIALHGRVAESFGRGYDTSETLFAYSRKRLEAYFYPALENAGRKVLDVGCGTGHYIAELRRRGFEVSGVDGSAEMLKRARFSNPEADLRQGLVTELPFADGSFDTAICIEVFRYLPDPLACIREMARVLRPGGLCLATAMPRLNMNGYWFVNRIDRVIRFPGLRHLKNTFTSCRELRKQFEAAGFDTPAMTGVYFGANNWAGRLLPALVPRLLRWSEPIDERLARIAWMRRFSNMLLVSARKRV